MNTSQTVKRGRFGTPKSMRFTPEQAAAIREAARKAGVSESDVIRAAVEKYLNPQHRPKEFEQ